MNDTVTADLFDGKYPIRVPVALRCDGLNLVVTRSGTENRYAFGELRVSPRVADSKRFVDLPNGEQLLCPNAAWLDRLPAQVASEGFVAWLEQRWAVALSCLALLVILLSFGYVHGLPVVARAIAKTIPLEREQAFGTRLLETLDRQHLFQPTNLDAKTTGAIRSAFHELVAGLPAERIARVEIRRSELLGANAIALPGGTIVVADELVDRATPDELSAVLAHELGHVEGRHALRQLLQASTVALVVATITGDATSSSVAISSIPMLLDASYSQDLENEADAFAFELLIRHDISPDAFASIMEKLGKDHDSFSTPFDSHPSTEERIERARNAAKDRAR
jgi:Zn-dependent protease with chaperone function